MSLSKMPLGRKIHGFTEIRDLDEKVLIGDIMVFPGKYECLSNYYVKNGFKIESSNLSEYRSAKTNYVVFDILFSDDWHNKWTVGHISSMVERPFRIFRMETEALSDGVRAKQLMNRIHAEMEYMP